MVVSQLHINAKKSKVVAPPTGPQKLFYDCDSDLTVWYYTDLHTELLLRHYFTGSCLCIEWKTLELMWHCPGQNVRPSSWPSAPGQLLQHSPISSFSSSDSALIILPWFLLHLWTPSTLLLGVSDFHSELLPPLLRLLLPILGSLTFPCHFLRIPFFLFNFFPLLCNSS